MTTFLRETAVTRVGDGTFEATMHPDWRIVRGANGGHIAAVVLRSMIETIGDPLRTPRSLTVHFTRAPDDGPVRIETAIERTGRTMSTVSGRMHQTDRLIAIGLCAFSADQTGPEFSDISMPEVPPPEDVAQTPDRPDFPFGRHFDYRPVTGSRLISPHVRVDGTADEPAEVALWMRLREPQLTDHAVVTQLCDAFAPSVFIKLGTGGGGAGVPTIEMTYHFREVLPLPDASAQDWYLGVFRTSVARGGFIEEDGWLWSRRGTLVAQSRQLALLQG